MAADYRFKCACTLQRLRNNSIHCVPCFKLSNPRGSLLANHRALGRTSHLKCETFLRYRGLQYSQLDAWPSGRVKRSQIALGWLSSSPRLSDSVSAYDCYRNSRFVTSVEVKP